MWGASALLALIEVTKPKGKVFEHELLELERQVPATAGHLKRRGARKRRQKRGDLPDGIQLKFSRTQGRGSVLFPSRAQD